MRGSEYLAKLLVGYGVTHVFFVEVILRKVIQEAEALGLKGILTHTENAAGYMADGYSRVTQSPGVCMAQSIGSANLAGGIMDGWLANSPIIAITGKKASKYQNKNAYQEGNHGPLYEGITKFNVDIDDSGQMPFLFRQGFREAVSGKSKPVHFDVRDFIGRELEDININEPLIIQDAYSHCPPYRPSADLTSISEAAVEVNKAQKPVIVVGRGGCISGAENEIYELASKGDIPVLTTPDGKCIIDENDPLWGGIVGGYGMLCANQIVSAADLVIYIGCQTSDQTTNDWTTPLPSVKVIQIDIESTEIGRNYPNCIGLLGDAKVVAQQLVDHIDTIERPEWRKEASAYRDATLDSYKALSEEKSNLIRPERLCAEITTALPDDAIVVADTGWSATWSAIMLRMKPGQKYFRAAGSLGWAFPASLGVKCGVPNKPVFCFTGDGAFYYHMSEMETAYKNGINTVTIINNNNMFAQCTPSIKRTYTGSEYEKWISRVTFSGLNITKVAEEFGLFAIRVEKAEDIQSAIAKAVASGKPAIVEIMTDGTVFAPSPK